MLTARSSDNCLVLSILCKFLVQSAGAKLPVCGFTSPHKNSSTHIQIIRSCTQAAGHAEWYRRMCLHSATSTRSPSYHKKGSPAIAGCLALHSFPRGLKNKPLYILLVENYKQALNWKLRKYFTGWINAGNCF